MEWSVSTRRLHVVACLLAAGGALAACSGGGTSTGFPAAPGAGNGNGNGNGSGGATAGPTAGATNNPSGATASPTSGATGGPTGGPTSGATNAPTSAPSSAPTNAPTNAPTAAPTSGGTTSPTSAPSGSITSSLSGLTIGPSSIVGNLGQSAQIGILDPTYTGPIALSVTGDTLLGDLLSAVSTLQTGVLQGQPGTADVLTLNLADIVGIGALGAAGAVVNVCETARTPPVCLPVILASNPTASQIGTNISDAVIVPGTFQLLSLASKAGVTNFSNFTVTSSNNNVTIQNLGNGQYNLGAAAGVAVPATAIITVNYQGQSITIPVMIL